MLGLGAFGGGSGCARALCELGARVTVSDLRPATALPEALETLADLPLRRVLGSHPEDLFHGQWVVVNPGVPDSAPALELARARGCRLTTEVNLAIRAAASRPAAAVTGTHGKSTCCALAAHLLRAAGRPVLLGGNLGGSLLQAVLADPSEIPLLLELSSFQTERLDAPPGWPGWVVLTSLGSDHLDRHGDREAYWAAKRRLLAFQGPTGRLFLPHACPDGTRWRRAARGRVEELNPTGPPSTGGGYGRGPTGFLEVAEGKSRVLAPVDAAPFREAYRLPSLLGALAIARAFGCPREILPTALASWRGLPHRLEELPAPPGRRYLDNGVATHPEATAAALRDLEGDLVLCAGGYDKGLDLTDLADACLSCREVHLSGPGGERLSPLLAARGVPQRLHPRAEEAMRAALAAVSRGGTLLYSPSFSSFDEYRNFSERARKFRDLCRESREAFEKAPVTETPTRIK